MSKSFPEGCIFLTDEPEQVYNKIMRANTDSISGLTYDKINRKNIANLIDIMAVLRKMDVESISAEYENCGHQMFKELLSKYISEYFTYFRENYKSINDEKVIQILKKGTSAASEIASINLGSFLSCIYK